MEESKIKRPFFWITGAFVLGEVTAYRFGKMAAVLAVLLVGALLWMMTEVRKGRFLSKIPFKRLKPPAGQSGMVLCIGLGIFCAGFFRMGAELRVLPIERAIAMGAEAASAEGTLDTETSKNGSCTIVLNKVTVTMDQEVYRLPAIMVSVDEKLWKAAGARAGAGENREAGARAGAGENREAGARAGAGESVPGMKVKVRGRPELFAGARNPGEFDYALYYRSMKLRCRMKADTVDITSTEYIPLLKWAKHFRMYVSGILDVLCDDNDKGLYQAVLLGDKTQLSEDVRELYQKNGIAHLLAVSGLHVSLIGMGIYAGFRRIGLGYGKAGFFAGCAIFFYGCLTGFGPSVFRAVFMIFCSFLAAYLGRTYDLLSALALSLLLLAADAPFCLFTGGVQLSYGAVTAIGIGTERLRAWEAERGKEQDAKEKAQNGISGFWISLFIQVFTYPVILYHFFEFPIYGILLNLVVIPLMAYVVGSGIAAIALYSLAELFTLLRLQLTVFLCGGIKAAAVGAMGTGHYILAFYSRLCEMASKLPFYSVVAGRPELWKIILYYAAVLLFLFWNRGGVKRQKTFFLAAAAAAAVCLTCHPVRGLEVNFLDVGQGDGIFLQTSQAAILVDCGSSQMKSLGKSRLVPFLKSRGVSKLDFVFVSHGDMDHISGIEYLLEKEEGISVENLVFSCLSREDESCMNLAAAAEKRGCAVRYMEEGEAIGGESIGGKLSLTAIYPENDIVVPDKNEQSLVLLARYGAFSMLLTGDVEKQGEARIVEKAQVYLPERITVLKVAHHGSESSTGGLFLKRVNPSAAILSYGAGNSYGHPSPEVVERLESAGTRIWRTEESGAVKVKTDGKRVWVSGFLKKK